MNEEEAEKHKKKGEGGRKRWAEAAQDVERQRCQMTETEEDEREQMTKREKR